MRSQCWRVKKDGYGGSGEGRSRGLLCRTGTLVTPEVKRRRCQADGVGKEASPQQFGVTRAAGTIASHECRDALENKNLLHTCSVRVPSSILAATLPNEKKKKTKVTSTKRNGPPPNLAGPGILAGIVLSMLISMGHMRTRFTQQDFEHEKKSDGGEPRRTMALRPKTRSDAISNYRNTSPSPCLLPSELQQ